MGTNFYLKRKLSKEQAEQAKSLIDGFEYEEVTKILETVKPIHIGKRSGGWRFIWNAHFFKYFEPNTESIDNFLKSGIIVDECDNEFTYEKFMNEEVGESLTEGYDLEKYYTENHSKYIPIRDYNYDVDYNKISQKINKDEINRYGEFVIGNRLFTINEDFS